MDEKVLEDIQFHQETLSHDANSPLHLIREKEMAISGRVLAAKSEAESIVASARKKAVEMTSKAEDEAGVLAEEHRAKVLVEVEAEIEQIKADADVEIETVKKSIADRSGRAVTFIVNSVTEV
ncbi:MAG: V-type ATPase subunit subunit G family protein [Actinomycetota bacterium]|nr:V-type ATPase subunit subunit G family protein [Actinomycetota bacterium]